MPSLDLESDHGVAENFTELEDTWDKVIEDILRDDHQPELVEDTSNMEEAMELEPEPVKKSSFEEYDVRATMDQIDQYLGRFLPYCQPDDYVSLKSNICLQDYCRRPIEVLQHKINGLGFVKKRFNITQKDEIHSYEMELEAMYSMRLSPQYSPYLAQISCHGEDPDRIPYVLYEFLSGDDLSWENQFKGMSSGGLKKIFAEFILGLEHFHHITGTIHGDVKPNNLMFASYKVNDYVKMIDYGGMLPIRGPLWSDVMMFNDMTTAPEVYGDDHAHDRSTSDWFSMGATLYWLYMEYHIANSPESRLAEYLDGFVPIKIGQDEKNPTFTIPAKYPPYFEPGLVDLLQRIVISDPTVRLNITSIKQHSFFEGLEWDDLAESPYPVTANVKFPACYAWEEKLEKPSSAYLCFDTYPISDEELKKLHGENDKESAKNKTSQVQANATLPLED
ncbi:hypothetical protein K7432_004256 [Basidiobolus ranarum]|uniref:non-specific serine/threonine protein kinase n=1 Tax=Basidiobolus ranarum TaxID=34480 RepID=A0ABR2W557_9FUNG